MNVGSRTGHIGKAAALFLAAVLLLTLVFSAFLLAVEADHECSGEDCSVCALLQLCETLLRRLEGSVAALAAVSLLFCVLSLCVPVSSPAPSTPVSRKVRLNN